MYAIIRTGGKQAKVSKGDVIDVERLRGSEDDTVSFTPLLIVGDDGAVVSGRDRLKNATVTAKILGATAGDKVDIFKYKAKTGYRRRSGHRQKYTSIEILEIDLPAGKKQAAQPAGDDKEA
jgi:large subunit ribosomal protein L21